MSVYTTLKGKLHSTLQNDFWLQILEAIAEELEIQKEQKKEKVSLNDLDSLKDTDLLNLATKYGYEPNLILDNSFEFLKKEVKSIPYRIKNKTAIKGLLFSFSMAGREGEVYNTTYDNTDIARIIDQESTDLNIAEYVAGTPFTGVVPEVYFFTTSQSGLIYLDTGRELDELPPWTLDRTGTIPTTKHIAVEYFLDRLITEEGEDFSITPSYIEFMLSETQYNRRASNIPHVGIQVNSVVSEAGFYDSDSSNALYTIPSLKLQASLILERYTNTIGDFQYFVAGIGKKGLPSAIHTTIFNNAQIHLPFSDEGGAELMDVTENYSGIIISGNSNRVIGILGRSLDFKADTYATVPSFVVPTGDWTYNFFTRIDSKPIGDNDKERYLLSSDSIDIFYREDTTTLTFNLKDGTTTYTGSMQGSLKGKDLFIQIEHDSLNEMINIYLDSVLELTLDVTGNTGFDSTSDLLIGTNFSDPTNSDFKFNGLMEEISFHSVLFSASEKTFLYNTKYGDHTYLADTVYRVPLTSSQKVANNNGYLVNAIVKANTANDELVYISDGVTDNFASNSRFFPVVEGSVKLSFRDFSSNIITVSDDKNGNIFGERYSGHFNYDTGAFELSFFRDYDIDNIVYSSTGGETGVSIVIQAPVKTTSFDMTYVIGGVTYTGRDDGVGVVFGDHISSGTINYVTGQVEVTFDTATDDTTPIRYSYQYTLSDIIADQEEVKLEYQTVNNLELTECGYENADGKLVHYTSFPKCQFGTPNAFLANNTIISRKELLELYYDDNADIELYYDDSGELVIYS